MISHDQYLQTIEEWKHCPMGNYVCPVHRATYLETHSPRGLALLMANIDSFSSTEEKKKAIERLFQCSLCRLCQHKSRDETSVPDAVAYFRWQCWQKGEIPEFMVWDTNKTLGAIDRFTLDLGRVAQPLFLVDPVTEKIGGDILKKASEKFNFKTIVLPESLVLLYNWGMWEALQKLGEKLEKLSNVSDKVIIETSLDEFIIKQLNINIEIESFASFLESHQSDLPRLDGKRIVAIPDVPEKDVSQPQSHLYRVLQSQGANYYTFSLQKTIPIVPKEFPAYRDTLHARLFPSIADRITSEVFYYASLYDVQLVVTESLETANIFNKFRKTEEIKVVDLFDLALSS